jgi:hypothetical protein
MGEMMEGCQAGCKGVGFNDYFQKMMKRDKLKDPVNNYRDRSGRGYDDTSGGWDGSVWPCNGWYDAHAYNDDNVVRVLL